MEDILEEDGPLKLTPEEKNELKTGIRDYLSHSDKYTVRMSAVMRRGSRTGSGERPRRGSGTTINAAINVDESLISSESATPKEVGQ